MNILLVVLVALGGAAIPVQIAANNRMKEAVQSPSLTIAIAFLVGSILMVILTLSGVLGRGNLAVATSVPWWAWTGGILSAFAVTVSLIAAGKLSQEAIISTFVLAQLVVAALLDHFGWLGVKQSPLNVWRVVGAVVVFGGVLLMQRK